MTASLTSVRVSGALLTNDVLAGVLSGTLDGLTGPAYHLGSETPREAAARVWTHLLGVYRRFRADLDRLPEGDPAVGMTRERWLGMLLSELGYGRVPLTPPGGLTVADTAYPVSHVWDATPIHLLGWGVPLDKRTPGVAGAAQRAPHAMVQELLNRCDAYLWAIVSNGRLLRLLRDSTTLTGQAFVEFDLESMFDGELFAEFALLYLFCHQSRVEVPDGGRPVDCWLERWRTTAVTQGVRALNLLRDGVQQALETLGTGFLQHPANAQLRDGLARGTLSLDDLHQSLLRLIYRLLFWSVAEGRGVLPDASAADTARHRYAEHFSATRLRRLALRRQGSGHADVWISVRLILRALGRPGGEPRLALPGLGGLFSNTSADVVTDLDLGNQPLLSAVRSLSLVQPKGQPRRLVDFRHLGADELGSVYESLLELVPRHDPITCTFTLEAVVHNDRKATGSYYTPTDLVNLILDAALDPVLDDAERQPDPEQALLDVTVCDPAIGSGHFVVAAARRIALRLASVRSGESDPTPADAQDAMHDVVTRCIYGVDVNPLAAELAKVSLWLEAVRPGKPLSFLDHHIKAGNALLGATPRFVHAGIPDAAYAYSEGDDRRTAAAWRKANAAQRDGQYALFGGVGASTSTAGVRAAALEVSRQAQCAQELADVAWAAQRYQEQQADEQLVRARRVADAWCGAFLQGKTPEAVAITQATLEELSAGAASEAVVTAVDAIARRYRLFHWDLEFPEIFMVSSVGSARTPAGWTGGFRVMLGNPPFVNAIEGGVDERVKRFLRFTHPDVGGVADLAFYFLDIASRLVAPSHAWIGLVQPRNVLNAPALDAYRGRHSMGPELRPVMLYAPNRDDIFEGPAVYVAAIVLGEGDICAVSATADLHAIEWREVDVFSSNWWTIISSDVPSAVKASSSSAMISELFEVVASMTTADAYDVVPYVIDQRAGSFPKLVTTGLIDPGVCLWGTQECRYLKNRFSHPRIVSSDELSSSLRRRLLTARRPKILVAGLSKRIECFLDDAGEYIGAVSTFSIFHPADNVRALEELCAYLLSDEATYTFVSTLGANAMGGGSITMKKKFLAGLPCPVFVAAKAV